jgi:hypothetical protein
MFQRKWKNYDAAKHIFAGNCAPQTIHQQQTTSKFEKKTKGPTSLADSPTKLMSLVGSVGTSSGGRVWCTRTRSPRVEVAAVVVVDNVDVEAGGGGDVVAGGGMIGSGGLL